MKLSHLSVFALSFAVTSAFAADSPKKAAAPAVPATAAPAAGTTATAIREIDLNIAKVGDVVHWMPEKITVHPGEKIKFVARYDLPGGAEFHGFTIKELGIAKQVNRGQPLVVETEIPADMKTGEIQISCQFHPKHAPAELDVEAAKSAKK